MHRGPAGAERKPSHLRPLAPQEAFRRLRSVFPDAAEDALKAALGQHVYLAPTVSALYQQLLLRPTSRAATYGR